MPQTVPARKDILLEHTWNAESIFPNDAAWENEFNAVSNDLPSLAKFRGHLTDNATSLADFFTASEALEFRAGKVVLYASMKHTVDTTNQAAAALNDRARGLAARVANVLRTCVPPKSKNC
jgi:oligoendopeptidase F